MSSKGVIRHASTFVMKEIPQRLIGKWRPVSAVDSIGLQLFQDVHQLHNQLTGLNIKPTARKRKENGNERRFDEFLNLYRNEGRLREDFCSYKLVIYH
jgi:hypothetical protein